MMRIFKYIFTLSLIFFCVHATAQNQSKKWYFGNQAGLDFMTSPPTALSGSMTTFEGCASIADAAGNLLFYTDGSTIYNQTHVAMANGTGLMGFSSSSQSAVIVKQPGNSNIYFVFTQGASPNGTRYSVVDMNLALGQGSVTSLNNLVQAPSSEKLTSVRHCNGIDIWVMSHDFSNNVFKANLVTSSGVNLTAVTSAVGTSYSGSDYIGILKFSPNGKKLASGFYGTTQAYEVYDFDPATGLVSNALLLGGGMNGSYGVEFSPDGSKLYGTRYANNAIYQWDLCAGSNTAIAASQTTIVASGQGKGAMQLGPDGKIYVCRGSQTALGVINNPNVAGTGCNFVEVGQTIAPKTSYYGLPNFITSQLSPPPTPFTHTVSNLFGCQTASYTAPPAVNNFSLVGCSAVGYSLTNMVWNFGDPMSGALNTSTLANPSHAFSNLGTYTTSLIMYYTCGGGTDTIRQVVNINQPCISVTSTSITCANLGSATVQATGGIGPFSYTWMPTAQTTSIATGLSPGAYTLTVFDFGNNFTYTASAVFNSLIPLSGLINNGSSVTCNGAATASANVTGISGGSGSQNYLWTNGVTTYTTANPTNLTAGNYTATISDALTGCAINGGFFISQPPALTLAIVASNNTICAGASVSFTASTSGGTPGSVIPYTYSWTAGSTSSLSTVTPTTSGVFTYSVTSRDGSNCQVNSAVAVTVVANPTVNVLSALICPSQTGTLSAIGASSYSWNGSAGSNTFAHNPLTATVYTVTGETAGCVNSTTASITLKSVPVPTVSSNSPVCNGRPLILQALGGSGFQWNGPVFFNSSIQSPTINPAAPNNSGVYNVTVTAVNGCTASGFVNTSVNPTPTLAATGGTICVTQTLNLSVTSAAAVSYTWTGPNSFASNLQNPSISNPVVQASGIYTVRVRSAAGCTNVTSINATVSAMPLVSFTSDSPKCQGTILSFNASTSSGGLSYSWSGPNAFATANVNPVIGNVPLAASGNYTLTLTRGPCVASVSHSILINPLPSPMATNNGPVCDTKSVSLSAGISNVTYAWTGPASYTADVQNPQIYNTNGASDGVYMVVVTDSNTCQSSSSTYITILPNPNLQTTGTTVCFGAPATISVSGAATYTWTGAGGFSALTAQATIPAATNVSETTYFVTGKGSNSCVSFSTATVYTRALPVAIASITPRACENSDIYFNGEGGNLYSWSGPIDFMSTKKSFTMIANNVGMSGTYKLTVSDIAGCKGITTAQLIIDPAPAGGLANGATHGCVPFCSDYKFQNSNPATIVNSSWQMGGQIYSAPSFSQCFTVPGDYLIKGTFADNKNCSSTFDFKISVYPLPQADFSYFPLIARQDDEVAFTNMSIGENLKNTDWYFVGDRNKRTGERIEYTFKDPGFYPVAMVVKNAWGCADTAVETIEVEEDFFFFVPNAFTPNDDELNDNFLPVGRGVKSYHLLVFNRWGALVFESHNIEKGWNGKFKNDDCPAGVYTWQISARSLNGQTKNLSGTVLLEK